MKKRIIPFLLVCAMILAVAVACSNNPGGGGGDPEVPKRPATLTLGNFKQYYKVGAQKSDLSGSLYYTDPDGKITTLSVKDEAVQVSGFDSSAIAENKTIKFTYEGIDCVSTYSIVKPAEVVLDGTVVFDRNTTYTFKKGSNEVKKEIYQSWYDYYNLGTQGTEDPVESTLTYSVEINTSGATIIRFSDDSWPYRPDGKGGIDGKPTDSDYFFDNAPAPYFYVSTTAEDSRMITNPAARGKYLVVYFDFYGNMYMWFTEDTSENTLLGLSTADAIKLDGKMISFDAIGVFFNNVTADATKAKNLSLRVRDGYASTEKAFSIVSSTGDNYNGYSYIMRLTNIEPQIN